MTKQFIIRLEKTDGNIVANSEIITINGLGVGAMIPGDFIDNSLTGSITTDANRQTILTKVIGK